MSNMLGKGMPAKTKFAETWRVDAYFSFWLNKYGGRIFQLSDGHVEQMPCVDAILTI